MRAHTSPRWIVFVFACLLAVAPSIAASQSHAAGAHGKHSARPVSMASVRYIYHGLTIRPPHKRSRHAKVPDKLYPAYGLDTGRKQRGSIQFTDKTLLHINQNTDMVLNTSSTKVTRGEVYEQLVPGTKHTVRTASGIGAASGTRFDVKIVHHKTIFIVVEGALRVSNKKGSVLVKNNQETVVAPGSAPKRPVHVDASKATNWVNSIPPPTAPLPEDIALDTNGGHIISYASTGTTANPAWDVRYINDGRLDRGWGTDISTPGVHSVTLAFADNRAFLISSFVIDPAANYSPAPQSDLKHFAILGSTTGTDSSDFTPIVTGTARPVNALQRIVLKTPVAARYIELMALSNQGSSQSVEVAELEVVGGPAPLPEVATSTPVPTATSTAIPATATPTPTAPSGNVQIFVATPKSTATSSPIPVTRNPPSVEKPTPTATLPSAPSTCTEKGSDPDAYHHSGQFGPRGHPDPCHVSKNP